MGLGIGKVWWGILIGITLGLNIFKDFPEIAHAFGSTLAVFLYPLVIVGLVILVGRVFKKSPSRTTRRAVFFPFWGFALLSLLARPAERTRMNRAAYLAECVKAAREKATDEVEARMDIDQYCACALDKMLERNGLDSTELPKLKDRNSVLFNEMLLPCAQAARRDPLPRTGNVSGLVAADTIPVLNSANGIRVKVNIGNDQYYFLFDSGASDIMISASLEQTLTERGLIHGYLTNMQYEMANGDLIDCRRAIVNGIQIGEFLVDSSVVAIYDGEIGFLLGKSFLDNFSSWTVTSNGEELVLVR